jgi:benzil reductase ((S)-benzoin forming)
MHAFAVTGVSRGLGAALFSLLAGGGHRVLAIGRRFTPEQEEAARRAPARIRLHAADLADPPALRETFDRLLEGVDSGALIHNAAVVEPIGAVGTLSRAELKTAVTINLTAPMLITDDFLAARPDGLPATVLFVSSGAATRPIRGWAAYCATKAGAEMFHRVAAEEHPDVRIVNVNPGRMDTGMQAALRGADFPDVADYVAAHEQGKLPDPAEVARRICAEHLSKTIDS